MNAFHPVETVARPFAYLIPAHFDAAIETLQRHGLDVRGAARGPRSRRRSLPDRGSRQAVARPAGIARTSSTSAYSPRNETRRIPAGTRVVKTAQPLGDLAVYLLEPRSEDGLATWKQFDDLKTEADFPASGWRSPRYCSRPTPNHSPRRGSTTCRSRSRRPAAFTAASRSRARRSRSNGLTTNTGSAGTTAQLLKIEARTGRAEPYLDADPLLQSLRRIKGLDEKALPGLARRLLGEVGPGGRGPLQAQLDPTRKGIMFRHDDDLYYIAVDGSAGARLTDQPGEETLAKFSPDGRQVAFVRDHDLHAVDVADPKERALTTGGPRHPPARRGRLGLLRGDLQPFLVGVLVEPRLQEDRVHGVRRRGGRHPDDARRHRVPSQGRGQQVPPLRRAQPARPAGSRRLSGGANRLGRPVGVLGRGVPDQPRRLAARLDRRLCYVQDRVQTWLDLLTIPVAGEAIKPVKPKRLFRDESKAWIADQAPITFLKDGSFLWLSERDGWKHIYHYAADGGLKSADHRRPLGGPLDRARRPGVRLDHVHAAPRTPRWRPTLYRVKAERPRRAADLRGRQRPGRTSAPTADTSWRPGPT